MIGILQCNRDYLGLAEKVESLARQGFYAIYCQTSARSINEFIGFQAFLPCIKLVDLSKKMLGIQGIQAKSDFFSKPYLLFHFDTMTSVS